MDLTIAPHGLLYSRGEWRALFPFALVYMINLSYIQKQMDMYSYWMRCNVILARDEGPNKKTTWENNNLVLHQMFQFSPFLGLMPNTCSWSYWFNASQLHGRRPENISWQPEGQQVCCLKVLACVCWATISCSDLPQHTGIVPRIIQLRWSEPYGIFLLAHPRAVKADRFLELSMSSTLVPHKAESCTLCMSVVGSYISIK